MKEEIAKVLADELKGKLQKEEILNLIEIPPSNEMGDYSFPCFSLAKIEKKSPLLIAEELKEKLRLPVGISNTDAKAGYLNFFADKKTLAENTLKQILKEKKNYGRAKEKNTVMIEFPSPNTNKPLHLGHLRNMSIGESVSQILEFRGNKVIRANLYNDRGVHICKSMIAYKKWGDKKTPEKEKIKSDHFVGDYYVLFNQKAKEDVKLEEEAQELLVKWESKDKETLELWKKMNTWAFEGFAETFRLFGLKFDQEYYESKIYDKAKEIVELGLEKNVFQKREDGAIIINLENEGLGEKVIVRADGTSVYITQDLYLAKLKDEYKLDGSFYVVGNEQNYHFQVLFAILKKLGFKFATKLYHLSYGMVELPEGKMKSREGTVVDADDIIKTTKDLAQEEVSKRFKLSKKELENRSLKIALSAIKYTLLKSDITKNMVFNPKEAISFEGNTGPYLLYSYARASSIIKKVKKTQSKYKIIDLKESEIKLIKKLSAFPDITKNAYEKLSPSEIAVYSFELAQIFNEFYHACPVLGAQEENFRLKLVEAFRIVMKNSLELLGIDAIEEM